MTGRIPRNFIDELMTRVDIVELIQIYLPSLKKAGHTYTACCPFHHEKTPSFKVSPDKQFYYCFGCGAHGNAVGFLMNYQNLDYVEAIHELATRVGMQVVYEQSSTPVAASDLDELYTLIAQVAEYYQHQLRHAPQAIHYLKQRGLTGMIAKQFGIGYAPSSWNSLLKQFNHTSQQALLLKMGLIKKQDTGRLHDYFANRIMFPIYDPRGRVIAFGGRVLDDSKPKYLNSPDTPLFKKHYELYGWHLARQFRPLDQVVVVEGYMDVVALAQHEIRNVVATLGTATSEEHVKRLFRNVTKIVFCFDGDEAGQKAAWRALEKTLPLLQDGRQVEFVFLPHGDDPDSLVRREGKNGFDHWVKQAIPLSNFLFNRLTQQVKLDSLEGQTYLATVLAKPLLEKLPENGIYRASLLKQLRELVPKVALPADFPKSSILTPSKQPITTTLANQALSIRDVPLIHQAIVYLLHRPQLSQQLTLSQPLDYSRKLAQSNHMDSELLYHMLELTKQNPHLTLGTLCEHWRQTDDENTINRLAILRPLTIENTLVPTEKRLDVNSEFLGSIQRVCQEFDKEQSTNAVYEQARLLVQQIQQERQKNNPLN